MADVKYEGVPSTEKEIEQQSPLPSYDVVKRQKRTARAKKLLLCLFLFMTGVASYIVFVDLFEVRIRPDWWAADDGSDYESDDMLESEDLDLADNDWSLTTPSSRFWKVVEVDRVRETYMMTPGAEDSSNALVANIPDEVYEVEDEDDEDDDVDEYPVIEYHYNNESPAPSEMDVAVVNAEENELFAMADAVEELEAEVTAEIVAAAQDEINAEVEQRVEQVLDEVVQLEIDSEIEKEALREEVAVYQAVLSNLVDNIIEEEVKEDIADDNVERDNGWVVLNDFDTADM